eukprot:scaffold16874_cov75-Phaeocystis_antarctica.AAC.3
MHSTSSHDSHGWGSSPPVCEGEGEGEVWVRSGEGEASDSSCRQSSAAGELRREARPGLAGVPEARRGAAGALSDRRSYLKEDSLCRDAAGAYVKERAVSGGGGGAVRAVRSQGGGAVVRWRKRACECGRMARVVHAFIAH